jgi:heat shock gene repressor HrcA
LDLALTPRQERVLRVVIEEYIASGAPVGSKYLSEHFSFGVAASTIRNDLADLEDMGMLAHRHTSAGRRPTDDGYRHYVDILLGERREAPPAVAVERDRARSEIDDALRETAEALSRVTELLAVVSAPAVTTAIVRHIEILSLQPHLVMVVIITTSGQVTKRIFTLATAVDEGLAEFVRVYLNERLVGTQLGTRRAAGAFESLDLRPKERAFLDTVRPAFETLGPGDVEGLHLGGASRLLDNLTRRRRPPQRGPRDAGAAVQPAGTALGGPARGRRLSAHRPRDDAAVAAGVFARRRQLRRRQPQPRHRERAGSHAHGLPARHRRRARHRRQPEYVPRRDLVNP